MPRAKKKLAAIDRTGQSLVITDKSGATVVTGEVGETTVAITGVAAGTKVAAGDYQAAYTDGAVMSDKVDIPAFEVPAAEG